MNNYFVLTYSKDSDLETVYEAAQILKNKFSDKQIIVLPDFLNLKDYTKEDLKILLTYINKYIREEID